MSKGKVVVLGLNGHIGRACAESFRDAGWDVTGMARTDMHRLPGIRFVAGNSDSVEDMRRAIGDAGVVVNALNMRYDLWFEGRMEAQMARVLEAMGTSGRTLLFPGNIYNYAADNDLLTPDLPQNPSTPRGAVRMRVERMFRAAADRGDVQVIVIRAGDFFGPGTKGDWFDQVVMREVGSRRISIFGTAAVGHSWAYLPDLARCFVALASLRQSFGAFENFHFAGYHVTPEQMLAAIAKALPFPVRSGLFPFWMLRAMGLFDPVIREVARMRYIWQHPLRLSDPRLDDILGQDFATPFEQAVAATVRPFAEQLALESQSGANGLRRFA